jgi:hypothetical protein
MNAVKIVQEAVEFFWLWDHIMKVSSTYWNQQRGLYAAPLGEKDIKPCANTGTSSVLWSYLMKFMIAFQT